MERLIYFSGDSMTDAIHLGNFLFTGAFHARKSTKVRQQLPAPFRTYPIDGLELGHRTLSLSSISILCNTSIQLNLVKSS